MSVTEHQAHFEEPFNHSALPHFLRHVVRLWLGGGRVLNSGVSFINTFSFKIHIKVFTEESHVIGFAPPPLHGPGWLSRWVLPSPRARSCVCAANSNRELPSLSVSPDWWKSKAPVKYQDGIFISLAALVWSGAGFHPFSKVLLSDSFHHVMWCDSVFRSYQLNLHKETAARARDEAHYFAVASNKKRDALFCATISHFKHLITRSKMKHCDSVLFQGGAVLIMARNIKGNSKRKRYTE